MSLRNPAAGFDDPLQVLSACHEKIEMQLQTLERLVPHLREHGADREAKAAAVAVTRYFDTSCPMHHRDEDEDLFPLLRRLGADANRPEVCGVIDELEREHATMDVAWSRLRQDLDAITRGRANRLDADLVTPFAWLYRRHMRSEAAAVLPFAREALGEADRAALGERMSLRRSMAA